jgi:inner membrane protein
MLAPTHVLGGFAFTTTFAAICGQNVMESPWAMCVCLIGSLAPDCDNPRAPAGLAIYPIAKLISQKFAHRTITHSILILSVTTYIFYLCGCHPLIWFLSYFSHLFLDMLTKMGVPLFYPFFKNKCVIGNSAMRPRTGDLKYEGAYFVGFAVVLAIMMPLAQNGFWTTYNSNWKQPTQFKKEQTQEPKKDSSYMQKKKRPKY